MTGYWFRNNKIQHQSTEVQLESEQIQEATKSVLPYRPAGRLWTGLVYSLTAEHGQTENMLRNILYCNIMLSSLLFGY